MISCRSAAMPRSAGATIAAANDDGCAAPSLRLVTTSAMAATGSTPRGSIAKRLVLAFLIWGGVLPPEAGGLSDYLDDELLGLMARTALRNTLSLR